MIISPERRRLKRGSTALNLKRIVIRPPVMALAALAGFGAADARATSKEFISGTSLTSTNYNPSGTPGATDNVVIDSGSPTGGAYTITATTLNIQDLAFSLATTTAISNTTSTNTASTLELNGGRGAGVPLLDENSTKTLTIKNGSTGALNVSLGGSGSFEIDNTGGLTISSNIGEVNAGTTLTVAAGAGGTGTVTLSGTNSFSGGLVAMGSEVDVTGDASLGAAGGSITINGGRLGFATNSTTIGTARSFFVGANPTGGSNTGTLSIKGSITVTYGGVIQNVAGSAGDLVKQGGGTFQLGGVSTYTGNTFLNNGITQLTTANNRLPVGTTVNLGQSASANVGTLDLGGLNQQIAGLVSTSGAGETAKNTVTTSTGASTLTLGGGGTYAYGDGTTANSGVITGAVSILKNGTGTQTFGDANTYTGSTTVSGGTLIAGTAASGSAVQALGGTSGVFINGGGTLQMGAANQFDATPAPVQLSGSAGAAATFGINGNSQGGTTANGVGALTLASGSASNIIDFGNKAGIVTFAGFMPNGATITVNNYLNNNGASGQSDELIFNQDEGGNLANIVFTGYGASSEAEIGTTNFYEVFPLATAVPEPTTVLGGMLLVVLFGIRQRQQVRDRLVPAPRAGASRGAARRGSWN